MTRKARASRQNKPSVRVSDWSHPTQTPAIAGVYEVKPEYSTPHRMFALFDGTEWFADSQSPEGAAEHERNQDVRESQQVTWRGITK